MTVKDRMKSFLRHENIGQAKFSSIAGLSRGYVNNIVNTIGAEALHKISTAFPSLNTHWLLTGEGEMLLPAKNPFSQITEDRIEEIMTETLKEKLIELYNDGVIYPAAVHNRIMAEKDKRIEELQREIWELQKKLNEVVK